MAKRSKFNPYFKRLIEDETIQWLKKNDPNYSDSSSDKGLEYPYLTLRKEMIREYKETSFSNVKGGAKGKCREYVDLEYDDGKK